MRTHQALTRETVIKPALKSMNCVTSANLSKAEPPTGQMREAARVSSFEGSLRPRYVHRWNAMDPVYWYIEYQ